MGAHHRFFVALDIRHEGHEPCVEWLEEHDAIPVFPGLWLLKKFPGHAGDVKHRLDQAGPDVPLFVMAVHPQTDFAGHLLPASMLRELEQMRTPPRVVT
jgi:hypothetical protein